MNGLLIRVVHVVNSEFKCSSEKQLTSNVKNTSIMIVNIEALFLFPAFLGEMEHFEIDYTPEDQH